MFLNNDLFEKSEISVKEFIFAYVIEKLAKHDINCSDTNAVNDLLP